MDKQKQTNMTLTYLFIRSEKLAQATDEFLKWLKICAEGFPFNIYTMAEASDFKFGTQLGFARHIFSL